MRGIYMDLTGERFGKLVAIKRMLNENKHTMWLCKCECGIEKIIRRSSLTEGRAQSCGCSRGRRRLSPELANLRGLMDRYKGNARRNGHGRKEHSFKLTEEQFKKLTKKDCYYCRTSPSQIYKGNKGRNNGYYIYNGIDRIDNNLGYTIENTVTCCIKCNKAKSNMTLQDFRNWVKKIYDNMYKRG